MQEEEQKKMQERLLKLIDGVNPKHLWKAVKKDRELFEYIDTLHGKTFSEKIFNFFNPNQHTCQYGSQKIFNSFEKGYRFCGKASTCQCAKESVSKKSKESHALRTAEQKAETVKKTVETNLVRYGVANAGQTSIAKQKHAELYSDKTISSEIAKKVKLTKLERHGSENYNNSEKIRETFREKRNSGYWNRVYPDKDLTLLHDKSRLEELYHSHTPHEIAEMANVHVQTVFWYLNEHGIKEKYKSAEELEVVRFLKTDLGISNIVENTRKLLPSGKELDIYLPEYKIAIEYNGVYWHHEDIPHITRSYHSDKFKECAELGIQLITIFSYFWAYKKDVVKKLLVAKLNKSERRVYARNCSVVELKSSETKRFFEENHVQGYTAAQVSYGLKFLDELVAIMTFSRGRIAMGKSRDHVELVRYATACSVVGGASKLLSHFLKNNEWDSIVSYSDNEWSNGKLYHKLGFELESDVPPSYWYVSRNGSRMYHRFTYSKQKLVKQGADPNLTESQITKSMGLLKLWDCGKKKWILRKDKKYLN